MPQITLPPDPASIAPLDPMAVARKGDTITEQRPGLFDTTVLSTATSVYGTLATQTIPSFADQVGFNDYAEPGFDPYKIATPEYLAKNPWMAKPYLNGTMDHVHSSAHLASIEARQEEDWRVRERLGQASLPYSIVGGILGSAPDIVLSARLGEIKGIAGAAQTVESWVTHGPVLSQLAKRAIEGAAVNLGQEELARAANPNRNVDEGDAARNALFMGAGFGVAIHGTIAGIKTLSGKYLPTAKSDQIRADVGDSIAGPTINSFEAMGKSELEQATQSLRQPAATMGSATAAEFAGATPLSERAINQRAIDANKPQYTILRTKENAAQYDAFKAAQGDTAVFNEHPMQARYDLEQEMLSVRAEDLGAARNAATKATTLVGGNDRLLNSKSPFEIQAMRLMFDAAVHDDAIAKGGLNAAARTIPAEGHRMILQGEGAKRDAAFDQLFRQVKNDTPFEYASPITGERNVFGRGSFDKAKFGEAMWDTMAAYRTMSDLPSDLPKQLKAAIDIYHAHTNTMAEHAHGVGLLETPHDPKKFYIPQWWDTEKVSRDRSQFVDQLIAHQREQIKLDAEGRVADPMAQPVIEEAISHDRTARAAGDVGLNADERKAISELASQNGGFDGVTVADLAAIDPALPERYRQELDILFERRAKNMADSILRLDAVDGMRAAVTPSVFKGKVELDQSVFKPFLRHDVFQNLAMYDHKVVGQIAARQAIKEIEATPLGQKIEALTGKKLADEAYNPNLLGVAMRNEYQAIVDAASKAGDTKLADHVQEVRDKVLSAFESRMSELTGSRTGTGAWGWSNFAARQIGKGVTMAYMGKSLLPNLAEVVNLQLVSRMTEKNMGLFENLINSFAEHGRDYTNQFAIVLENQNRNLHNIDLGDIVSSTDQRFGQGRTGRVLNAVDRFSTALTQGFMKTTGMPAFEGLKKRVAAGTISQGIIQDARKMVQAADLVKSGTKIDRAYKNVGLTEQMVRDMNVLGMNTDRARRLMAVIDQHGTDMKTGQRIDSTFDGVIHPEMEKWAAKDRDLFNAFNFAVNSKVADTITTPKILSRPLGALKDNQLSPWAALFHQFQNFAYAYSNQTAAQVIARPATAQASYIAQTMAAAVAVDAAYKLVGGTYTPDGLIREWRDNPQGLAYSALNRSPLLGYFQRPIGSLESWGVGPGRLLGSPQLSTIYGHSAPNVGDMLGPGYGWFQNFMQGTVGALRDGTYDQPEVRHLWNALPFHNHLVVDGLRRFMESMDYEIPLPPPRVVR